MQATDGGLSVTLFDLAAFAAAVASLALAAVAIWLSIFFYRMTSEISQQTREAAKGIGASVERLEKLFDRLYADTFSIVKDTFTDMRRHTWPSGDSEDEERLRAEVDKRADQMSAALREDFQKELSRVFEQQRITDDNITQVREQMREVLVRAMDSSRHLEMLAREATLRARLEKAIRSATKHRGYAVTRDLIKDLEDIVPLPRIIRELRAMRDEGLIETDETEIGPITYVRPANCSDPWPTSVQDRDGLLRGTPTYDVLRGRLMRALRGDPEEPAMAEVLRRRERQARKAEPD